MNKRYGIFYSICFLCTAAVVLTCVIGLRKGEIYIVYPEPDFTYYLNEDIDSYGDTTPSKGSQTQTGTAIQTVNINTAGAEELASVLPGIGEVKAQRIVEYRAAVGGFNSVDELVEVEGIGEATLEKIRPYCVI